jgi:hypothetical protein
MLQQAWNDCLKGYDQLMVMFENFVDKMEKSREEKKENLEREKENEVEDGMEEIICYPEEGIPLGWEDEAEIKLENENEKGVGNKGEGVRLKVPEEAKGNESTNNISSIDLSLQVDVEFLLITQKECSNVESPEIPLVDLQAHKVDSFLIIEWENYLFPFDRGRK